MCIDEVEITIQPSILYMIVAVVLIFESAIIVFVLFFGEARESQRYEIHSSKFCFRDSGWTRKPIQAVSN